MLKPTQLNSKFEHSMWDDSDRIEAVSDILGGLLSQMWDEADDSILAHELDRCLSILKAHASFLKRNLMRALNG